jgi:hypothetical protein
MNRGSGLGRPEQRVFPREYNARGLALGRRARHAPGVNGILNTSSAAARLWLASFSIWACSGGVDAPSIETGGVGGSAAGRSGASNAGAGSGGRAGAAGAEGSPAEPDAGHDDADDVTPDAAPVVSGPPRTYCDAVTLVLQASCGNGSCHSNRGATIGDFAVGAAEAAAYVSRGSARNPDCGLIIDPIEPQNSLILTKVTGQFPKSMGCGAEMPVGSFEDMTVAQIDCLSDWVEQFKR